MTAQQILALSTYTVCWETDDAAIKATPPPRVVNEVVTTPEAGARVPVAVAAAADRTTRLSQPLQN